MLAPRHDLLVRAALCTDPDAAGAAYGAWREQVDVELLDDGEQRMLPLLADRFAAEAPADPVAERLRRIVRFSWLASQLLLSKTLPMLEALVDAGIPVVVIKGEAILHHTGLNPGLRPMDDLDVLVPLERSGDAAAVLGGLGLGSLSPLSGDPRDPLLGQQGSLNFFDRAGAQVDLHWHLLSCSRHPRADDGFHARAVPGLLREVECRFLSPEDTLLNVVEHGFRWAPQPALRWASDATLLLRSCELDWDLVVSTARRHRVAARLGAALDYLVEAIDAPVPGDAGRELRGSRRTAAQWHRSRRKTDQPDGGPRLPGSLGRALDSWDEHAAGALAPGRRPGPGDVLSWLRSIWLLNHTAAVPAHAAFVALGRPWPLRRLLGAHRRAAGRHRELPPYAPGEWLRFGTGEPGGVYAVAGWAAPADQGRWTLGGLGRVVLPLSETVDGPCLLEADCTVVLTPYRQDVAVDVVADGRRLATWTFVGETWGELRAASMRAPRSRPLEILFVVRPPAIPMDARVPGSDDRQLGIFLTGLRLAPAPSGPADRSR